MSKGDASVTDAALSGLGEMLSGRVRFPGSIGYERSAPFNSALVSQPAGVVTVADQSDIATTIRFAADHGMRVAVQATGHGTMAQGDDVLVIHTGDLQSCSVDPDRRLARVAPGVRAGRLVRAAADHGLAALTGSSPGVGVVGYLSGGGIGPLSSTFGVSSDYVRSLEVITGDGVLRRVSLDEHPDLFWAMRGGRGALGVITAVEVELPALTSVYAGTVVFPPEHMEAVLRTWADWSAELPDAATTSLTMMNLPASPAVPAPLAGRPTIAVSYASVASPQRAEALFAPMRAAGTPILGETGQLAYADLASIFNEPTDPMPVCRDHVIIGELTTPVVDALLSAAGPTSSTTVTTVEIRRLAGAFAQDPPLSAVSHRDNGYALTATGVVSPDAGDVQADVNKVMAAVAPWTSPTLVRNFTDTDDPETLRKSYSSDTVARLLAMSKNYDPSRVMAVNGEITSTAR